MGQVSSKLGFFGAGFVLAIATLSFAQSYDPEEGTGNVGIAYMVQPDGTTARMGGKTGAINSAGHEKIMAYAMELPPGSVLYRHNNKLHAVKNQPIEGKMVHEHAKDWVQ